MDINLERYLDRPRMTRKDLHPGVICLLVGDSPVADRGTILRLLRNDGTTVPQFAVVSRPLKDRYTRYPTPFVALCHLVGLNTGAHDNDG